MSSRPTLFWDISTQRPHNEVKSSPMSQQKYLFGGYIFIQYVNIYKSKLNNTEFVIVNETCHSTFIKKEKIDHFILYRTGHILK